MSAAVSRVMSGARGVVFDKDGTLVDLDARWVPVFSAFISGVAQGCEDPDLVVDLSASLGVDRNRLVADGAAAVDSLAQIVERVVGVLAERGRELSNAQHVVDAAIRSLSGVHGPVEPIGDLIGSFTVLRDAGLSIGVATSDDRANTVAELTELDVVELVDTLHCADDGTGTKPDPRVLSGMADDWGVEIGELVFVGDSRNDMATARAAGCPFIGRFDDGHAPSWATDADARISSIDELVLR